MEPRNSAEDVVGSLPIENAPLLVLRAVNVPEFTSTPLIYCETSLLVPLNVVAKWNQVPGTGAVFPLKVLPLKSRFKNPVGL